MYMFEPTGEKVFSKIASNACGVPQADFQRFENHFGKFPKPSKLRKEIIKYEQ